MIRPARCCPAICRVAFAVCCLVAAPAGAEIYKWVDDAGVTHYSQQPPPEGTSRVIETRPTPPSAQGSETDSQAADDEQETIAEYCEELRRRVDQLAGSRPLRIKNDDGTLRPLEGDEREAELQQARAQVTQHCSDG